MWRFVAQMEMGGDGLETGTIQNILKKISFYWKFDFPAVFMKSGDWI